MKGSVNEVDKEKKLTFSNFSVRTTNFENATEMKEEKGKTIAEMPK